MKINAVSKKWPVHNSTFPLNRFLHSVQLEIFEIKIIVNSKNFRQLAYFSCVCDRQNSFKPFKSEPPCKKVFFYSWPKIKANAQKFEVTFWSWQYFYNIFYYFLNIFTKSISNKSLIFFISVISTEKLNQKIISQKKKKIIIWEKSNEDAIASLFADNSKHDDNKWSKSC